MALPPLLSTAPSHFIQVPSLRKIYQHQLDSHWRPCHSRNCIRHYDDSLSSATDCFSFSSSSLSTYPGEIFIGLLDSTTPDTEVDEIIGCNIKNSLSLSSSTGRINLKTPSTRRVTELPLNYSHLKEGACVWM
ncbi:hypothetical protein BLNAU_24253 [Blattamonas nauphoetae]|uniref:Uncharacterized protein n=1 Tax=Blattamonas nauphoetae TaxID=2049346 RepID=A0ABQ9WMX0_9EUKA|nr:hypothetical protein BLNAU_24253 [Blattamonas nauphoetae]